MTSEIQAQQSKLEASAREAAELRRSKTLMERELNTIAASDVPPTGTTGYEGRLANLTPSSPTKGTICRVIHVLTLRANSSFIR